MNTIIIVALVISVIIMIAKVSGNKISEKRNRNEESALNRRKQAYQHFEEERINQSSPHLKDTTFGNEESTTNTSLQRMQQRLNELAKLPKDSTAEIGKYLLFDTETTGLPRKRDALPEDLDNWPYIVEIAWFLIDEDGLMIDGCHHIIKQNVSIPKDVTDIHHITTQDMLLKGEPPQEIYSSFIESVNKAEYVIAHNLDFDLPIIECELLRNGFDKILFSKKKFCTMKAGRDFCTVYDKAGRIKNPKLVELFGELYFQNPYLKVEGTHNALADTNMLYRCFMKMKELKPNLLDSQSRSEEFLSMLKINTEDVPETKTNAESVIPIIADEKLLTYFGDGMFNGVQVVVTGVSNEDKERCWEMIADLNGKVVKSVTKNLAIVILGAIPGWKKIENIKNKIASGERIIGITDIQLEVLHRHFMKQ